jgi:hypothetical protein
MQLAREALAHGMPLRRRATHAPAPARPAAIPSPPTVAAEPAAAALIVAEIDRAEWYGGVRR